MKILIVNTFYFPNMQGGTEHSVKLLAEGLRQKGNEVAVYCVDNLDKGIKKENINGILVYRGNAGIFNNKIRLTRSGTIIQKLMNKIVELRNYTAISEFKFVLDDFNPDIVHTNNLFGISSLFWKVCKENKKKIIHTVRDYWIASPTCSLEIENNKSVAIKCFLFIYRTYFKYQTKYVNIVTAPSSFTLDIFRDKDYFRNAVKKHVNNSIELDINKTKEIIREKIIRDSKIIKFLFVGSLYEIKGIRNLLKAFMSIDNKNITLTICGSGDLQELVEKSCIEDNRIIYCGKLSSKELEKVFIENDVLIVPSIWDEPFGRVVIEGNGYGLPVIGSNKGGVPEIINTIKCGEIFIFNDLEDLKDRIEHFSDRDIIKGYFDNIIKNIEEYSIKIQVRKFLELYEVNNFK